MSSICHFPIQEASQVGDLRRRATGIAEDAGLREETVAKVALAATELGTNLVKHTGGLGGTVLIQQVPDTHQPILQLISIDRGPGMSDITVALRDGFSTTATAGEGLGSLRRMAHAFDIHSRVGQGTAVLVEIGDPLTPRDIHTGGLNMNCPGEDVCGDGWAVAHGKFGTSLLVVDGLGHGPAANQVATQAVAFFSESHEQPLDQLFLTLNSRLRGTRGGAVSVARIHPSGDKLSYMGIGNIAGIVHSPTRSNHMVSIAGIVGSEMRKVKEFTYDFTEYSLLIMHSDGLTTKTGLESYPGLNRRHPALIAAVLYRDFNRGRDDSTVVIHRSTPWPRGDL